MSGNSNNNNDLFALELISRKKRIFSFVENKRFKQVLDVGCGHGELAALIKATGLQVHAFDISPTLLNSAEKKMTLANECFLFEQEIKALGGTKPDYILRPLLWQGDATKAINYLRGPYAAVICTGGTLQFLQNPERALILMMVSLSVDGRLFLEFEQKKSAKALLEIMKDLKRLKISRFIKNLKVFRSKNTVNSEEAFVLSSGKQVVLPKKLMSVEKITELAEACNCRVRYIKSEFWLEEILGWSFFGKSFIQKTLSIFYPFNRASKHLWMEIEKYK